jgi:hypothetical protein
MPPVLSTLHNVLVQNVLLPCLEAAMTLLHAGDNRNGCCGVAQVSIISKKQGTVDIISEKHAGVHHIQKKRCSSYPNNTQVSIISKKQGTVDIPEYHYLADPMPGVPVSCTCELHLYANSNGTLIIIS